MLPVEWLCLYLTSKRSYFFMTLTEGVHKFPILLWCSKIVHDCLRNNTFYQNIDLGFGGGSPDSAIWRKWRLIFSSNHYRTSDWPKGGLSLLLHSSFAVTSAYAKATGACFQILSARHSSQTSTNFSNIKKKSKQTQKQNITYIQAVTSKLISLNVNVDK
jgi:hypothetical protein